MNTDATVIEERSGLAFDLDFKMSSAEHFLAATSRYPWLPNCGIGLVAVTAFNAGLQFDSHTGVRAWFFGLMMVFQLLLGWNMAMNNALAIWLQRRLGREQTSHTRLELDSAGIRGFIEVPSPWHPPTETKRINYAWRKVRKVHRPPEYIVLEFHGGGIVTIPNRAFNTRDDVQQCLDWAEDGLAQQRSRKPAAAR